MIKNDSLSKGNVKSRISQAKKVLIKERQLLTSSIDIGIRKYFLNCTYGVLSYMNVKHGLQVEKRNYKQKHSKCILESFWCYTRLMKVNWMDRITNKNCVHNTTIISTQVLNCVLEKSTTQSIIIKRRGSQVLRQGVS